MRLAAIGAAAVLTGCVSAPPPDEIPSELVWSLVREDGRAWLGFAAPESDWVILTLSCAERSGVVRVEAGFPRDWPGQVFEDGAYRDRRGRPSPWVAPAEVRSGALTRRTDGYAEPDELNGGLWTHADLPATDPLWAAFRRTGEVSLRFRGQTIAVPPAPPAAAGALLKACAKV